MKMFLIIAFAINLICWVIMIALPNPNEEWSELLDQRSATLDRRSKLLNSRDSFLTAHHATLDSIRHATHKIETQIDSLRIFNKGMEYCEQWAVREFHIGRAIGYAKYGDSAQQAVAKDWLRLNKIKY